MKRAIFLTAMLLCFLSRANAENAAIFSAMKDEMTRSMKELKLEGEAGPYYISYLLTDAYGLRISADSGAITINSDNRNRSLKIDLRVGSYAQDNSNFLSLSGTAGLLSILTSSNVRLPLDDNYDVMRRQIWLATDRTYKNALETLTKKKAALQNMVQSETLPDFVKSGATSSLLNEHSLTVSKEQWQQYVDQLAKLFVKQQGIQKSRVDLTVQIANSYYVNSEGATGIEPSSSARLAIVASTQAEDGMPLANYRIYTVARPEDLPDKAKLEGDVKNLISELLATKAAPQGEEYSGPVLFVNEAAGELFSQGFSNLMAAKKTPLTDSPQNNAMLGRMMENPFLNKLNMKVAANFLSMKDAPTMKNYNQKPILGAYTMDDEGVLSSDVSLIENGILKNLLASRTPVKGAEQSNGHGRGGSVNPSVIRITSSNKKSYQQLKQNLIDAAKEEGLSYGYLVRGLTPVSEAMSGDADAVDSILQLQQGPPEPTQFRLTKPYLIFKVYPDGREEPVRGIEFGSLSINSLRNVLATSDDETIYPYSPNSSSPLSGLAGTIIRLISSGASGSGGYATVITPSLLISGIDLKKSSGRYAKLPIVSYPAK
jgi:predicted Zn-dependent protease